MLTRQACPSCEVLETVDVGTPCWSCGGEMVPSTQFSSPMSPALIGAVWHPYRHPMTPEVTA